METPEVKVEKEEKKEDKKVPLPKEGKIFMLDGYEYRVVYINQGKNRFSCCPAKQVY
jgi:hypothetical protein